MADLSVNDPVHVNREDRQLEGVVAYLGLVSFSAGEDWVGVRLTGSSVGLGKNDGSVQGKQYFDCPPQCGLFVKKSAVSSRELTRLEELRLRRELAQASAAESKSKTPSKVAASPSSAAAKTPPSTTTSNLNRLEEIRQRRAALASSGGGAKPPASASSTSSLASLDTSSVPGGEDTTKLQGQIDQLTSQLKTKEGEIENFQKELAQAKVEAVNNLNKAKEMEEQVENLQREAPATAIPKVASNSQLIDSQREVQQLERELENVQSELKAQQQASSQELEKERDALKKHQVELAAAKTELEELQNKFAELAEQSEVRGASDASHYKERARLQGEVASLNRKVEQLELDKQELENNVEDLALDKEQLQEEKEATEDRLEELKLDAETAQMEVEELRMELEDAKSANEHGEIVSSPSKGGELNEAQDMAQNLSVQNARLREALIRLREQSAVEKMDLSRQLRSAEKEAEDAKTLSNEVESLRQLKIELEEQISDLKDMVEQGSAYEVMVEDLSDRVLSLEEELVACQQTIREMEEAADITAEMEEVQTEELRALNRDLEDRETIIRNLEEAIKMQRKREEDFQRTLGNYRTMVETLKQEKRALLELQQGGEGEKSDLVSASQKALARAAQLVQDAAEMRKREAQAAIDRIDSQVRMHLCERLERLLPPSVAAAEIASIKGELLLCKVVGKASLSLDGIARSFSKTIRARAWEWRSDAPKTQEEDQVTDAVVLSDEQQQMAATMIHQSEVAHVAIDVSGDLLWLLSAGQWPDILTPEASSELGAIMGHSMSELDLVLGNVLNTLKEEGVLSPHQSNIGAFRQTVVATMQTLRSHIVHDGESLVPMDWKPQALKLFRDSSRAKFSSLGCYAAVASVLNHGDAVKTIESAAKTKALVKCLRGLLKKLDQAASEAVKSCLRLAHLDVQDEGTVVAISGVADAWRVSADDLVGNIYNMLVSEEGLTPEKLQSCAAATDTVLNLVSQFASSLRSANLHAPEDHRFHPFSPEVADVWDGVTSLARSVRAQDGDQDDVNYLLRARYIEHGLEEAVDKEPKLALANVKIARLEKSLSLRSKEIAMQNARLAELEKVLAKTSSQPSPRIKSAEMTSSEEMNSLKQEIRVLTEAMDVLHREVEEYEGEIRFLKDAKSPKSRSRTPRRTYADHLRERSRSGDELQGMASEGAGNSGAFEAALFRPALQAARRDAAQWKSKAIISTLLELPPLNVSALSMPATEETKSDEEEPNPLSELSSALSSYRMETASVKVVDLRSKGRSHRSQLHKIVMKKASAAYQLDKATAAARQWLEMNGFGETPTPLDFADQSLIGRVRVRGPDPHRTVPTTVNFEDLRRIQMHLVQQ